MPDAVKTPLGAADRILPLPSAPPNRSNVIVDASAHSLAEEKFRLAVEACPNGMVMIDSAGTVVMVNAEVEQQFGYRREELIGQTVDMLVPMRLRSEHAGHRAAFSRLPEIRRIGVGPDLFGLRKDGSEFSVEIGLTPIRIRNGLLVLGVIVDVSDRKQMERLKSEFVSTVSHELRTPLTSISGSLGLLMGQWAGKLPASATRLLAIAHTNSQRLVRLINDILDIEKFESGRVAFKMELVALRPLVEQTIESNRGFAEGFGVHIRFDAASVDGTVNADPDRLAQVITNLLSNAVKFSRADAEVLVAVEPRGDVIRISVRDHGPGIPADFKSHVFERFAQADATSARQKGGTGLGLSIVKQIVERLGGEVGFDDALGGGTLFYVELPAWDTAAGQEIDLEAVSGAARILLCEGDRDAMITLRARLRQVGFAADFAFTAVAAVARADATRYAAILVDLQLPDSDGIDLILRMRAQAQYHDTPIIVVSGDPGRGREDIRSSRLNVLDWLSKPVDFVRLVQVLRASIAPILHQRARVLHVDDDHDVLAIVTHALETIADVISVDCIEDARRALMIDSFDLAVLDISLGSESGLDLLPDLHGSRQNVIPVIVFSARGDRLECDQQILVALNKSRASLDSIVATVRDRLGHLPGRASQEAV